MSARYLIRYSDELTAQHYQKLELQLQLHRQNYEQFF